MKLVPFNFDAHTVRSTSIDGEPWFVAADVAAALGYSATASATRTLDDEDKGVQTVHTLGGP
jgi:prophage antirepressor-like protein